MRGARGEQAHADDVFLLHRALLQIRQHAIAVAQIRGDAGNEQHGQPRRQQKAEEHAVEMQRQIARLAMRAEPERGEVHRPVIADQPQEAQPGQAGQRPHIGRRQQHGAEDHLQQEQRDEGIDRAARQIELRGERGDVEQKSGKEELFVDHPARAKKPEADQVQRHQEKQHITHLHQRQRDRKPGLGDEDGGDLAGHGDPAQGDQQKQVLALGDVLDRFGDAGTGRRLVDLLGADHGHPERLCLSGGAVKAPSGEAETERHCEDIIPGIMFKFMWYMTHSVPTSRIARITSVNTKAAPFQERLDFGFMCRK